MFACGRILPIVLLTAMIPLAAYADDAGWTVMGHFGAWASLTATSPNGEQVCAIALPKDNQGREIYLQYAAHTNNVLLQLWKDSWHVSPNTPISTSIQIDNNPWSITGLSQHHPNGDGIEFKILLDKSHPDTLRFIDNLKMGRKAMISFPRTSEPSWLLDISGANGAVDAFAACVDKIDSTHPMTTEEQSIVHNDERTTAWDWVKFGLAVSILAMFLLAAVNVVLSNRTRYRIIDQFRSATTVQKLQMLAGALFLLVMAVAEVINMVRSSGWLQHPGVETAEIIIAIVLCGGIILGVVAAIRAIVHRVEFPALSVSTTDAWPRRSQFAPFNSPPGTEIWIAGSIIVGFVLAMATLNVEPEMFIAFAVIGCVAGFFTRSVGWRWVWAVIFTGWRFYWLGDYMKEFKYVPVGDEVYRAGILDFAVSVAVFLGAMTLGVIGYNLYRSEIKRG